MSNDTGRKQSPIYFCYSPKQNAFLQRKGLRVIGVGINENTGRKFWQYERGAELDELLNEWSANRPEKKSKYSEGYCDCRTINRCADGKCREKAGGTNEC